MDLNSVCEWAGHWVPEQNRERFVAALRVELQQLVGKSSTETSPSEALARIQPDVVKIQDAEARAILGEIMAYVTTDQRIHDLIQQRITERSKSSAIRERKA